MLVKSASATVVKQQSALFDELGRLMRSIGAASQQTNYGYDRTDKLVAVTDPRSNLYAYARELRGICLDTRIKRKLKQFH
jgi:YD repeat-containing protein